MNIRNYANFKSVASLGLALILAVSAPLTVQAGSCSSQASMSTASARAENDIVETAVAAGDFGTLVAAVKAAGLVEALQGEGPFTVFAPTDEAFAALPAGTVESLLKPENRDQLVAILSYHVIPAEVPAKTAKKLDGGTTLNGQRVDIEYAKGNLTIDGANVIAADIEASNGIIHVIDQVILPATDDILTTAASAGSFNTLAAAIEAAGLVGALSGEGPFTVFAPTDEAFAALPAGTVENLLKPENKDQLVSVLTYHVVSGRVYSDQALELGSAETLQSSPVRIGIERGKAKVNAANLVMTDLDASNGVIHVIDQVLLPPTDADRQAAVAQELIEMAINRGAPMYNDGEQEACALIYEMTAQCLMAMDSLSEEDQKVLQKAIYRMNRSHDSSRRAWIMRDALDEVHASLGEMQVAVR